MFSMRLPVELNTIQSVKLSTSRNVKQGLYIFIHFENIIQLNYFFGFSYPSIQLLI